MSEVSVLFSGLVFLFSYIILFIGGFYLFYFSDFSFYVKLPLIISFFLIITYITYVLGKLWNNPKLETMDTFIRVFSIYSKFLLMIILIMIICILFYKIFMGTMILALSKSIWFAIGLIILVLALIKVTFYDKEENESEIVALLKDIVFYIPCLLTDSIEYIKQDYLNTPSTTFIVFTLIIVYLLFFMVMPKIMNMSDGIVLIKEPQRLNDNIISMTTGEINELINKNKPFYRKSNVYEFYDVSDNSYNIINDTENTENTDHYPYDEITTPFINEGSEENSNEFSDTKYTSNRYNI